MSKDKKRSTERMIELKHLPQKLASCRSLMQSQNPTVYIRVETNNPYTWDEVNVVL